MAAVGSALQLLEPLLVLGFSFERVIVWGGFSDPTEKLLRPTF